MPRKKQSTKRKSPTKRSTPTKRTSKTKRVAKTKRSESPVSPQVQDYLDNASLAELRVSAKKYGVKSGGIKKPTLKKRLAKKITLSEKAESSDKRLKTLNDPSGAKSVLQIEDFQPIGRGEDERFELTVIDQDIEPHKKVSLNEQEGVVAIEQYSELTGEQEVLVVMVSEPLDDEASLKKKAILDSLQYYPEDVVVIKSSGSGGSSPSGSGNGSPRIFSKNPKSKTLWNPNQVAPPPPTSYKLAASKSKSKKAKAARARIAHFDNERRLFDSRNWIYFYQATLPRGANKGKRQNDLVAIADFDNMQTKRFMVEKEQPLIDAGISYTQEDLVKTGGNELQSSFDEELNFVGLFDQRINKKGEWIPHFAKVDQIFVDDDGAGNYMAYMNNLYAYKDPMKPNMFFVDKEGKVSEVGRSPDELKVYKFWGSQLANSAAYRRNRIIIAIVKDVLKPASFKKGEKFSPLTYRTTLGTTKEFVISDQALRLAAKAYDPDATLIFNTSETKVEFETGKETDISDSLTTDSKVELKFIETEDEKQPLTSDILVRMMVKEQGLDPVASQVLLENLYQSGWVDYPRKDEVRAREDPVRLMRDIKNFRGTVQEREMLTLVHKAEEAHKQGKNFILSGKWIVKVDNETILEKPDKKTILIPNNFSSDQFDVVVNRDGLTDESITEWMQTNQIGTPATRMVILANMKEAGILTKINDRYVLDSRGIVLSSAHENFQNSTFDATELNVRISNAQSIQEIESILTAIQPIPRESTVKAVKDLANPRIEAQKDIAVLDTF